MCGRVAPLDGGLQDLPCDHTQIMQLSPHRIEGAERSAQYISVRRGPPEPCSACLRHMEPAAAGAEPRKLTTPSRTTPQATEITGAPTASATRKASATGAPTAAAVTGMSLLAVAGLGGVALLAWWAAAFRRDNAMLWMVPAGLVLLGTPLLAWFSVLASGPAKQPPPASELATAATLVFAGVQQAGFSILCGTMTN
ncbi:hypothetical protein HU200_007172 [Digitaria exilis]|uniref:Uncharacterized protein n=1 Tax=Digitaria exilis TaxID=1010633 RepID=A0A835KUL1_9POAL|nr:hypothetical protein HU200_007172 [Digitaria exilis]